MVVSVSIVHLYMEFSKLIKLEHMLKVIKIIGSLVGFAGALWLGFEIYDGWRDARVEDIKFQSTVINYMETDSIKTDNLIAGVDTMRLELANYKSTVDVLAQKHVAEIVDDSTLTRQEFLENMNGLMEYLDDLKKKTSLYQPPGFIPWTDCFSFPLGLIPELSEEFIITSLK